MATINDKSISEMTTAELLKFKKMYSLMTVFMAVLLIITVLVLIYLTRGQKFSPLFSIPFSLSIFMFLNMKRLKDVKQEIASRNNM